MNDEFEKFAKEWHSPDDLHARVESVLGKMPREDLFKAENKVLREAWQAATFARGYQAWSDEAFQVRLALDDTFADFELRFEDRKIAFQSTMAITRKLGDEYRGDKGVGVKALPAPESLPVFIAEPLAAVASKKARSGDTKGVHLLVYANYSGKGAQFAEVKEAVAKAVGAKFETVWIMTGTHIGCVFSGAGMKACDGWYALPKA